MSHFSKILYHSVVEILEGVSMVWTLVFAIKSLSRNSKGFAPSDRALNDSGVGKICNFQPVSHRISQTVQDRTKATIND